MSSKNEPDQADGPPARRRAAWSLAARLTVWYAASAFGLVLAATGFLYWAFVSNLEREDDQLLGDRARAIQAVMAKRPGDTAALRQEVEEEWEAHERTRVHIRIVEEGGGVLAETPGMGRLLPVATFPAPPEIPGTGTDVTSERPFRTLAVRAADGSQGGSPYVIQVALDRSQDDKLLAEARHSLFAVLGLSLLACAAVGYQIARRGMRPIRTITDTTRRVRPTNLSERVAPDGLPTELLTLAGTFNQMLDRIEQSFARLSRFSADIAHELRTPVNNLRGAIEVALGKPRSPEEYRDVLGSNLEECGRLARVIDSLLFLARAENPNMQVAKETFDVGEELRAVRDFYEAAASEKHVTITAAPDGKAPARLNRPLFQRAVGNLLDNALAHAPPGGTVTLTASGDGSSTTVTVADTGCGIPADHLPHVFDRFYRADTVRSSSAGNVGLGLAIVKSIVDLHGGTVQVASEVGRGTRVTMSFPREMTKS
jgi:two-component system heavy metal sensor histidine kinase CusS